MSKMRFSDGVRLLVLGLGLALLPQTAEARLYGSAKSGPAGDATGVATQRAVAEAIAEANAIDAQFSETDVSRWPEGMRQYCGSQAAKDVLLTVRMIRTALESIRDNWDSLVVQTVTLKKGWNAFYVYVTDDTPAAAAVKPMRWAERLRKRLAMDYVDPSDPAISGALDRVAALANRYIGIYRSIVGAYVTGTADDWPVESLFVYMGSTAAAQQFSTELLAESVSTPAYLSWSEAAPDTINISALPPGRVYTTFSTSTVQRTIALLGTGARAGAMTWHRTGGSENPAEWNYLGVAVPGSGRPTAEAVMQDLTFTSTSVVKLGGTDPSQPTFEGSGEGKSITVVDGEVLIASASAASSWYPAPTVTPSDGVAIAAGKSEATFTLCNNTAAAQVVTGTLHRTGILKTALTGINGIEVRESTFGAWQRWNFSETSKTNLYFVDTLSAGESRTYSVHFERTLFDIAAREVGYADDFRRTFAALMRFRYGGNQACTYLTLTAAPDNSEVTSVWPTGLWIGSMTFDAVSQVKGNQTIVHDVPAKGRMQVRAILHVATNGLCRLLHHVTTESTVQSNAVDGVFTQTRLYAGDAKPTGGEDATIRRVDSIAMDIDNPVVEGVGSLTNGVAFAWTMAPEGRGNPFHHPYHPDHDGLAWDFKTPAPSGDDMNNYRQGQVKPETWSIFNRLSLVPGAFDVFDLPDEISGTCAWELGNMRRKVNGENIRATGSFTLQRVESIGRIEIE